MFVFFFQAEDGIRDYKVTGVQTCALPIYGGRAAAGEVRGDRLDDLRRIARDEQRFKLGEINFTRFLFRRRLLADFGDGRFFREEAGEIVAGQRDDGEGEAVDFFRAQRSEERRVG